MALTTVKRASLALALLASAASASTTHNNISPRQESQEGYINSVCRPQLPDSADASSAFVVPPCIAVETIEGLCAPNGTSSSSSSPSPLALEAHAQCMCKGSFFSQWRGCQACQVYHGARSERDVAHFEAALDMASAALCGGGGKPTAAFQVLFESADYAAPHPSTGATTSNDAAPSDPAVSLYFTPTASSWGAGAITGSATAATAESSPSSPSLSSSPPSQTGAGGSATTKTSTGNGGSSSSSGQPTTTVSTTPAPGVAAPTAGVRGMLMAAVAGGAMAAAAL